jgi:hypothetical protein
MGRSLSVVFGTLNSMSSQLCIMEGMRISIDVNQNRYSLSGQFNGCESVNEYKSLGAWRWKQTTVNLER